MMNYQFSKLLAAAEASTAVEHDDDANDGTSFVPGSTPFPFFQTSDPALRDAYAVP